MKDRAGWFSWLVVLAVLAVHPGCGGDGNGGMSPDVPPDAQPQDGGSDVPSLDPGREDVVPDEGSDVSGQDPGSDPSGDPGVDVPSPDPGVEDVTDPGSDEGGTDPGSEVSGDLPSGTGRLFARQTVGASGGAIFLPELELFIAPGALPSDTDIEIRQAVLPDDAGFVGVAYELLPSGLVFQIPAQVRLVIPDTLRDRIGRLAAVLSLHQDPGRWQDATVARGPSSLLAFVPHFSTLWIYDPTNPGALQPICCTPKQAGGSPTACILSTSTGVSCDPALCDITPGVCGSGTVSPTNPCPCAPAAHGYTYADCLTCDPDKCIPDPQWCGPSNLCEICNDKALTSNPLFLQAHAAYAAGIAGLDCPGLAMINTAPPSTSSASWCYVGGAAKWCAFQEALNEQKCKDSANTIGPMCEPTGCCAPIVPGVQPPGGFTCGELPELECEVYAGQGIVLPQICEWKDGAMCPTVLQRPDCRICSQYSSDPGFVAAYQDAFNLFGGPTMTCYDVWVNAPPPPLVNGNTLLSSVHMLGTWCGHGAAAHVACGGTLGCPPLPSPVTPSNPTGTGPTPTTPVPTAVACGHCGDPVFLADPVFAAAYQGALNSYQGLGCADLDNLGVTSPMGAVGSAAYATTLARWCVLQKMREDQNCGPVGGGLPSACTASCCEASVPGVEPPNLTCSQLHFSYAECVFSAGSGYCTWDPTCPPI